MRQEHVDHLVEQVQQMVERCGDPRGFDARAWVLRWINEELPALGCRPVELLDDSKGFETVSRLLERAVTGAYS